MKFRTLARMCTQSTSGRRQRSLLSSYVTIYVFVASSFADNGLLQDKSRTEGLSEDEINNLQAPLDTMDLPEAYNPAYVDKRNLHARLSRHSLLALSRRLCKRHRSRVSLKKPAYHGEQT